MKGYLAVLLVIVIGLSSGCTIHPKIYIDGQPALNNVIYSENANTGIRTEAIFFRTYGVKEGDEELIVREYLAPIGIIKIPRGTKRLFYNLRVVNTSKRSFYNAVKVVTTKWKQATLVERTHVYSGHLSYKEFMFRLPIDLEGGETEFYVRFEDVNGKLLFTTLRSRYLYNSVSDDDNYH